MIGSTLKAAALGAAGLAALAIATPAATAAPTRQPGADRGPALSAAAQAYRTVYPQLSAAQARAAAAGQEARKSLYTALGETTFGGAWFDPPTGQLHILATTPAARDRATVLGHRLGLSVQVHPARYSFAALQRQADALRAGGDELSRAARGHVGIDVAGNRVLVAVPATRLGALGRAATAAATGAQRPGSVALVADPGRRTQLDAGCTSRTACDVTVRAGSVLWTGSPGSNVCSVGFTARDAGNQRYVYTAGHCSGGNGVTWGTGGIAIGPMWSSVQSGALDASIIKVTNSWFRYDAGGQIYNEYTANRSVPLTAVAPTVGFIWAGDAVCLAANFPAPNGPNYCGVVGTNSDPAVGGMVRVDGLDGCPGDSGGGWYWLTSAGNRYGYGLHSRSDVGCHGSQGGSHSWFSPLPTIKAGFTPNLTVETA
ncbi:MAG: streptogrisin [Mycobacteriales bacterium]